MSNVTSYTEVTETLKKPCDVRSEKEICSLVPWFQTFSKSFRELQEDVLKSILKESIFLTVPKRVAVIIQGEIGDCFYMLLKGNVSVFVQTAQENERILLPPDIPLYSLDEKISEGVYETEPFPPNFNRSLFGNVFNEIGSGKFFGELALMAKDCIRKASVITEDLSDLLVVKRDLYQRCLLEQQKLDLKTKREFIKCFPAFNEWNERQVTNLALALRLYQLKTGTNIVVQGEPFDGLHFIIKGQARISVRPVLHEKHFARVFRQKHPAKGPKQKQSLFKPRRRSEFLEASSLYESEMKEPKEDLQQAVDSISKICPLSLCVFDAIGIIGDIELMLGWNAYYSTVTCTEDCQILQLDTGDCFHILQTRSKRKMGYFLRLARDKVSVLLDRWPEPSPVRLLSIAQRELNRLVTPTPEARTEPGAARRKQFASDSAPPSMFPVISMTSTANKEKTEKFEESSDIDLMNNEVFLRRFRYSVSVMKDKNKDKKRKRDTMFSRAKNVGKTPVIASKGLKKLAKRETMSLNETQQRELALLEARILAWYDEMEEEMNIPADKCVPKMRIAEAFTTADVCRLLDEYSTSKFT